MSRINLQNITTVDDLDAIADWMRKRGATHLRHGAFALDLGDTDPSAPAERGDATTSKPISMAPPIPRIKRREMP